MIGNDTHVFKNYREIKRQSAMVKSKVSDTEKRVNMKTKVQFHRASVEKLPRLIQKFPYQTRQIRYTLSDPNFSK
jgi:hypothetical protein